MRYRCYAAMPLIGLLALAGPAVDCPAAETAAEQSRSTDDTATPQMIDRWIADLDSDNFGVRAAAMQHLIAAGLPTIAPLTKAVDSDRSLEVQARGVMILRELALIDDARVEDAARTALVKIATRDDTTAGRRAQSSLARLNRMWQRRAIARLEQLGVVVNERTGIQISQWGHETGMQVIVGEDFKGKPADLSLLSRLVDLREAQFLGRRVTGQWIAPITKLENVHSLVIKKAQVDDDALAQIRSLKDLRHISIYYSPVTDASVETLGQLNRAIWVRLYGTEMTAEGADKLREKLPGALVDFRRGAFLGISGNPTGDVCQVQSVIPGGAAAKAGVEDGDIVLAYNGKKVDNFQTLTKYISDNKVGDVVTLKVDRYGKKLDIQVKLGEWE